MHQLKEKLAPPPYKITNIMMCGDWGVQVLRSAVELGVFDHLQTPSSALDVASKIQADPKGTELLLNALVSIELLDKSGQKFNLNEISSIYLLTSSPSYMGMYLKICSQLHDTWSNLTETLRTGKPVIEVNDDATAEKIFPELAEAIFPLGISTANLMAKELEKKYGQGPVRVLDVACGSCVWSIPLAQMNPELKVDALDFSAIIEVAKKFTSKFGVSKQYKNLAGNWRDIHWEENAYDIIILGHILHSEGLNYSKRLIQQCARSIKEGGTLAIAEFVSNNERTAPVFSAMFAINMYLNTTEGCVFTENGLKELLSEAGFTNPQRLLYPDGTETPVWTAIKQ